MPTRMRRDRGFTLLEVMMATTVLAVGTVSVLMVFGTAIAFAHRRQAQQELTQVVAEARSEARSLVNRWRPAKPVAPAPGKKPSKDEPVVVPTTPAGAEAETAVKPSQVISGYQYSIRFDPVRRETPEAGWRTTITVTWGDRKSHQESRVLLADVIPDEELASSRTYEEERAAMEAAGARETR